MLDKHIKYTILVVSHGMALRMLLKVITKKEHFRMQTILEIDDSREHMVHMINSIEHLKK